MRIRKREPRPPAVDRVVLAAGTFARLADALDRNDFEGAAVARAELARLGYTVKARVGNELARVMPFPPRHEAATEGGGA